MTQALAVAAWARQYAALGLHPIALHGVVDGRCTCGRAPCGTDNRSAGKHPIGSGWQVQPLDIEALVRTLEAQPHLNLGLRMGRQPDGTCRVALDVDDPVAFAARAGTLGALVPTLSTVTAKGFHGVFEVQPEVLDRLTNWTKRDGVDLRAEGGQVVAPPSLHPSGVRYTQGPGGAPAPLPATWVAWVLAGVTLRAVRAPASDGGCGLERDDRWLEQARAHLRNIPGAVSGGGGTELFVAAGLMIRGWLLRTATADALLRAEWNTRCSPPWDFGLDEHARNWEHQLVDAEDRFDCAWGAKRPLLGMGKHAERPEDLVAPVRMPADPTWTLLEGTLMGAPQAVERALRSYRSQHVKRDPGTEPELPSSSAVIKWLVGFKGWDADRVGAELGPEAQRFAERLMQSEVQSVGRLTRIDQSLELYELRWNEMALVVEIDGDPWTDNHTAMLRLALEQSGSSDPEKPTPNGDIEQRARALAVPYHPVAEYLASLPAWDGVARVDTLWTDYFGAGAADDAELNRKLAACFLIGAVRRVLDPGCKVDMMPILLGAQGDFKSSGLAALVGGRPFFTDAAPGFGHRSENAMTLAGCWVWEIAEMQGMDRADLNAVKAFVTRAEDDVLLPYARAKSRLLRRSTLIGTTNDDRCLTDPTGSRRHPVVHINSINVDGLRNDRAQLWAEALQRCQAQEPHWLAKVDEAAMGARNAERYTRRDDFVVDSLLAWFEKTPEMRAFGAPGAIVADFTIADAVRGAFGGRLDGNVSLKIGAALKQLGVVCRRVGRKGVTRYVFPAKEPDTP